MADAPRLPVTAEASSYAPYSFTAILAVGVAAVFAVVMVVFTVSAFVYSQPFVQPVLLVMPVAAVVLAFAARRQILGSEGTRAGLQLASAAWWIAIVGGLGYTAYLAAVAFAVRQDAASQFDVWAKNVAEADPLDPKNPALLRAFHATLPPARQQSLPPTQPDRILNEQREELAQFRTLDVIRLACRNRGATAFAAGGVQAWEQDAKGELNCKLGGTLRCPEGEFELAVPMGRMPVEGRPVWQIRPSNSGYLVAGRLTRYGQLVRDLEYSAAGYVTQVVLPMLDQYRDSPSVVASLTRPPAGGMTPRERADRDRFVRVAAVGGLGWTVPAPDRVLTHDLFAPTDAAREATARQRFANAVRGGQFAPAGVLSQATGDTAPITTVTDKQVESRVAIELKVTAAEQPCRGLVVLACDDPALIGKLNELRAAAGTDPLAGFQRGAAGQVPWRVVRFESDMRPIPPRQGMGGPPQPGMPPG
jgi:hypothetical protein